MDGNELLDIAQAAAFLNVSETSLRRWTNSGRLTCLRIGRKRERRFRRADLLAFMELQSARVSTNSSEGVHPPAAPSQRHDTTSPPPRHFCAFYSNDSGRIALAVPFLLDGLREGSVCFLVAAPRVRQEILRHIRPGRESVRKDVESGRLLCSNYQKTGAGQWRWFDDRIRQALSTGVRSFRTFGDVRELLRNAGPAKLAEYERRYEEQIAARYPVVTICAYDARKFDGVGVLNALKGHPDTLRHSPERALA
ncbi:MAG: MEDS domain-containing protein [Gemmatimonadaceae bacterium]